MIQQRGLCLLPTLPFIHIPYGTMQTHAGRSVLLLFKYIHGLTKRIQQCIEIFKGYLYL